MCAKTLSEIEVENLIVTDKDKILDPTIGYGHKIDNVGMIIKEEIIDIKIIIEMKAEVEEDKTLGEV